MCDISDSGDTFLPFLSNTKGHAGHSRAAAGREPKEFSPLSTAQLDSNTHHPTRVTPRGGRAPPSGTSGTALGNCGSTGHTTPTWTKRQRKAPLQIHEKAPGPAVSQGRDTVQGSSGSGSVVHSVLTSPLMQGVGVSQLQECWHREGLHRPLGSGLPWQLCSPAPPT